MKCQLKPYQDYTKTWMIQHPYSGIFLGMGLGKTLATLSAYVELKDLYGLADKVLVIAPLSVAKHTWSDEIKKWDHLKHLKVSKILGSVQEREQALATPADVYLINRENVVWLVEKYRRNWPFKFVVIDELSSFKDSKAKRFRALKQVRPKIERLIGLTGTPASNSLIDLWPQLYLLDQGERLGKSKTKYTNTYFYPAQANGHIVYKYGLQPGAEQKIYDQIGDICVSMKTRHFLTLPPRIDNVVEVTLEPKERLLYDKLERDYILEASENNLEGTVVASNAAVLSNKLLQLANGAVYDDEKGVVNLHDQKLEALERIIEDSQGEPVLVFYNFKHDRDKILKRFKEAKDFDLKGNDLENWNNGKIPILLAHPQSAGHGLNLQAGGHIIVWYSLTWSLEFYQQANARLDRQGQQHSVIVNHIVAKDTVDERVMKVLAGKETRQDALLEAVKAKQVN